MRRGISLIAIVIAVGGLVSLGVWQRGSSVSYAADTGCPPGMPTNKCFPSTSPPTNPDPSPTPNQPQSPWPQSSAVPAGPGFFSTQQLNTLTAQYGLINIFQYGDTWIVIGNGQSTTSTATPPTSTPGGPLVAVEKCTPNASACLSPTTLHNPTEFTEVALPDPNVASISLETVFGNRLISISDGPNLGPITLDLNSLQWYGAHVPFSQIMNGTSVGNPLITGSSKVGIPLP